MKKTLILAAMLLTTLGISAQQNKIIYVDFVPDSTVYYPVDKLYIDFDQDGVSDAYLYLNATSGGWWFYCYSLSDWELYWCEDTITPINELSGDWRTGLSLLPPTQYEQFAVRRRTGNDYCYGWMKVSYGVEWWQNSGWHSKGYLVIDKQCFCTIPNYPLRWGQTSLSADVNESSGNKFASIHPNPSNGVFNVTGENLKRIDIYDVLGQKVLSLNVDNDSTIIDLGPHPAGVYLINVTDQYGRTCSHKVVKQ